MSETELSSKLHQWATQEMHFHPRGRFINSKLPDAKDFKPIVVGMMDVWTYVLAHAHSIQTVKNIRGNLALKQHSASTKKSQRTKDGVSQEREELLQKYQYLLGEVSSTNSTLSHVSRDLERLNTDISSADQQYQNISNRIHDQQRRVAMLKCYSSKISEECKIYAELAHRVDTKCNYLTSKSRKEDENIYYNRQSSNESDLETSSCKHVREACHVAASFLHDLLRGSFGTDTNLLSKRKELLWHQVEGVVKQHASDLVLQALCTNAQETALKLHEETNRINIKKDASMLRFKYENQGELRDTSLQTSVLHTVHDLLQEAHIYNEKRFLDKEKSKSHTWKLQFELEKIRLAAKEVIDKQYKGDPGTQEIAWKLFETEVETAAIRSGIHTMELSCDTLATKIHEARQEKELLTTAYQKIQDFQKIADNKQNLIQALVRQNINARSRLESQQLQILHYVENKLNHHEIDCRTSTSCLKGCVLSDTEAFTSVALPYLMFTILDSAYKIAVIDLSIHRFATCASRPQSQHLLKTLKALQFPPYKAPEYLLEHVMDLQQELLDTEKSLQRNDKITQQIQGSPHQRSIVDHILDLCNEVKEKDQEQISETLPLLQERLAQAAKTLTSCLRVKDTLQVWWDQPAQNCVPWIKVDDMSLQQWKDKWTVAVTRLRQLQIKPSS